jgi:uncharacterized protein YaiI (UPF0178 family)
MLYRVAEGRRIEVVLVANQALRVPRSRYVRAIAVGRDFDAADDLVADQVAAGDLVITGDIPLAARVIEKGALCLDPRGEVLDASNIGSRMTVRNLMEEIRESGELLGGPPPYHDRDKHRFAAALQRILSARSP